MYSQRNTKIGLLLIDFNAIIKLITDKLNPYIVRI